MTTHPIIRWGTSEPVDTITIPGSVDTATFNLEQAYTQSQLPCMDCGADADMIGIGHADQALLLACEVQPRPPWFKCNRCYLAWYRETAEALDYHGEISCRHCRRMFSTVESFLLWRPV